MPLMVITKEITNNHIDNNGCKKEIQILSQKHGFTLPYLESQQNSTLHILVTSIVTY